MTHPHHAGAGALARPPLHTTTPSPAPPPPAAFRLDRHSLALAVAARHRALAETEHRMVVACEAAAARGAGPEVNMADRATWDRATWNRYLAAAMQLEASYGPRMRRLRQEIGQLERLMRLPIAA